jgi:hypothetical protein
LRSAERRIRVGTDAADELLALRATRQDGLGADIEGHVANRLQPELAPDAIRGFEHHDIVVTIDEKGPSCQTPDAAADDRYAHV